MRVWIHSTAKSTLATPSAAFSIAAHVVLIGAAVYSTHQASMELRDELAEQVHFLPPPDRVPGRTLVEQLIRYEAPGAGSERTRDRGETPAPPGRPDEQDPGGGGQTGRETERMELQAVPSADSVYSVLTVDESAVRAPGGMAPVYPADLMAAGVEGLTIVRFVVDSTGRADVRTLEIMSSSHPAFTQAVRDAISGMRFVAARIRGTPVRQLVEQSFSFRIIAPAPAPVEHTRATPTP